MYVLTSHALGSGGGGGLMMTVVQGKMISVSHLVSQVSTINKVRN